MKNYGKSGRPLVKRIFYWLMIFVFLFSVSNVQLNASFIPDEGGGSTGGGNTGGGPPGEEPPGLGGNEGGGNPGGNSGPGSGGTPGSGDTGGETTPGPGGTPGGSTGGTPGGGDEEVPSGPSDEEIAAAYAESMELMSTVLGVDIGDLSAEQREEAFLNALMSLDIAYDRGNSITNSTLEGDPVLVTTGTFLLIAEDYEIPGSSFTISRRYLSEEKTIGSLGTGWILSLDSRIIRGITAVDEGKLNQIENLVSRILTNYNNIDRSYHASASIAANILNNIYLPARRQFDELLTIRQRGLELGNLNRFSKFSGSPGFYEGIGNDNLVLINTEGVPLVFEYLESGVWLPVQYPERLFMRIECNDGGGALSLSGFTLYTRSGIKKIYNGNGMLIEIIELTGNRVEIIRGDDEKISKITGPHGNEWLVDYQGDFISGIKGPEDSSVYFFYENNNLAKVEDIEENTTSFSYEGSRLRNIIKPDGSYITLNYGLSGENDRMLVTSTTHEGGASERFEYDIQGRVTTYTNHSGIVSRYLYDDKHRTFREEHSDGRVILFEYNYHGLLEKERRNGFEISYGYDSRGNITEKVYADGSRENWEWSNNDRLLRYVNRDGIVEQMSYDGNWNLVQVTRGGQIVFLGLYSDKNKLISSREGNRAEVKYEYDARDFLSGRKMAIRGIEIHEKWVYDALGRIVLYVDGIGRAWEYRYKPKEIIVITPTGLKIQYDYDNRRNIIKIIETDIGTGEERVQNFTYDKTRLLVQSMTGNGDITRYTYRDDLKLTRIDIGPYFTEYEYEEGGRLSNVLRGKTGHNNFSLENISYNRLGWNEERKIYIEGAGTSSYLFDPFEHIIGFTNEIGENYSRIISGAGNVLREQNIYGGFYVFRYNAQGLPVEIGREGENAVRISYNPCGTISEIIDRTGKVTRYFYDGRGLLEREILQGGENRYSYDGSGRLINRQIISGNRIIDVAQWIYNDDERSVREIEGGFYTRKIYFNAWGEIIKIVDGEGNENIYEYDGAGRLIKAFDGYGISTSYTRNEIGLIETVSYADGSKEHFVYDHLGNIIEVRDELGIKWLGVYDRAGRLIRETGRPGVDKEYNYDAMGRIIEIKTGGETIERYSYTNMSRDIVFTDGMGRIFTQEKNAFGNLISEVNRLGDYQRFEYDPEDRITGHTAYSGRIINQVYRDSEGIIISDFSDGTQNLIERDIRGNTVRVSNDTGTIRYRYDTGGRLIEQIDEGAGETTRYTYDRAGRRTRMQSGNRDVHYRYGRNGELLRVIDQVQRLEVGFEYDDLGREIRRIFGNGIKQETMYDRIGRVIMIRELDSLNRLLRAEAYVYDEEGRRSHSVDEEGRVIKYLYDEKSRLSVVLYPWSDEIANLGRREAEESGLFISGAGLTGERYSFASLEMAALRNALNRAAPMRGNAVNTSQIMFRESYTYDKNGNRMSKTTPFGSISYEYDEENRLLKRGDVVYTNDKDGNILSERGLRYEARYEYNDQGRMIYSEVINHVQRLHAENSYSYDAFGRRTLTGNKMGQALRTLYDGKTFDVIREGETFRDGSLTTGHAPASASAIITGNLASGERYRWISESQGTRTGAVEESYTVTGGRQASRAVTLYAKGEALAMGYSESTSTRQVYLGKDIMGSVRSVTTDAGTLVSGHEYDVFGKPFKGDLTGSMNLGYTGKPFDTITGLYNYGFRDYKPQAARFTTVDPIRDGSNWFVYVKNDPVNWIDLWGLEAAAAGLLQETFSYGEFAVRAAYVAVPLALPIIISIDSEFPLMFESRNKVRDPSGRAIPAGNQSPYYNPNGISIPQINLEDISKFSGSGPKKPGDDDQEPSLIEKILRGAAGLAELSSNVVPFYLAIREGINYVQQQSAQVREPGFYSGVPLESTKTNFGNSTPY